MWKTVLSEDDLTLVREHARFIGGGTCCGKTTIANLLSNRHNLPVFSADDKLGDYAQAAADDFGGAGGGRMPANVDFEHMWMRDPAVQLDEMIQFYHDVFPYVLADVAAQCRAIGSTVIAEGIAFLPELLIEAGIRTSHCAFLTMEKTVHDQRYSQRDWTPLMLEGCTDPARAFELWMQRDELFCERVRRECAAQGLLHIESNSSMNVQTVLHTIELLWDDAMH